MICLLLAWLIASFISISLGTIAISAYHSWAKVPESYSIFDRFFIGFCLSGAVAAVWSIFFPVNVYALLFLLAAVIAYWIASWGKVVYFGRLIGERSPFRNWLIIPGILFFVTVLIGAVNVPISYDTYLYHLQSILWSEQYPALPGLANVHRRLGFNSSVLLLNTLYSFKFLYVYPVFIVNSLTILFFSFWLMRLSFRKPGVWGLVLVAILYFFCSFYFDEFSSASTDLAPNLLCLYVLLRLMTDEHPWEWSTLIYIVVPITAVTMKISMMPIALLALIVLIGMRRELMPRKILMVVLVGAFIAVPWVVRNVILTGYVVFPFTAIDLFNFEWQVSNELTDEIRDRITSYALSPTQPMDQVLSLSRMDWFLQWWPPLSAFWKVTLALAAISPVVCLVVSRMLSGNGGLGEKRAITFVCLGVTYLGAVFWFFLAPSFRFSYALLLLLAIFPLIIVARHELVKQPGLKWVSYGALVVVCGIWLVSVRTDEPLTLRYLESCLVHPRARTSADKQFQDFKIGDMTLYVPVDGDQCYEKFPCTPEILSLKMRGPAIREGFHSGLEDETGVYVLERGIVYRSGSVLYDEKLKNKFATKLYVTSQGKIEFITSDETVWNSGAGWLNTKVIRDGTGFYYMLDGIIWKNGAIMYSSATQPPDSLYLNEKGHVEIRIVDGQRWNTSEYWLPK